MKSYKKGDKVIAKLFGGTKVIGTITNIEWDSSKDDYVADLDCGHWCYLDQIVGRA